LNPRGLCGMVRGTEVAQPSCPPNEPGKHRRDRNRPYLALARFVGPFSYPAVHRRLIQPSSLAIKPQNRWKRISTSSA
jgi:hypothetical protein